MRVGLIGDPLGHSFSPRLHAAFGTADYELHPIPAEALPAFFRERTFEGVNVTIPHKIAVIPLLDELHPSAEECGAVNTVVNRGGKLTGYNTDIFGMSFALAHAGISLSGRHVVILGSGDIGLIMARRLTLEGAEVEGVYEVKPEPSGLTRNIHQCLHDFDIPLHLSHTVTRVFGVDRLTAVEVAEVDDKMKPVKGTERIVECDALILSVGLIPENELAETLGVKINPFTKGPDCDQTYMSSVDGVFSAGNALNVFDLVDYVSECAADAGANAAHCAPSGKSVRLERGKGLLSYVPHRIDLGKPQDRVVFFFRSAKDMDRGTLRITADGKEVYKKKFSFLRPPEMQRVEIDFSAFGLNEGSKLSVELEEN